MGDIRADDGVVVALSTHVRQTENVKESGELLSHVILLHARFQLFFIGNGVKERH